MVYTLTSNKYGIINQLRALVGLDAINFYTDGSYWPTILVIAKVWKDMGMNIVIYLAVITGFDPQIYEAAMIDGAGRFRACISITLRLMMPTVCMLTIMAVGKIFYSDNAFDMDAGEVRRVRVTLPAGMPLRLSACKPLPSCLNPYPLHIRSEMLWTGIKPVTVCETVCLPWPAAPGRGKSSVCRGPCSLPRWKATS